MSCYDDLADKLNAPREGVYSESEQYWTVLPVDEWEEIESSGWVSIGGAGVDGIQFCGHPDKLGIYTYHPIESRFEPVANTIPDLIDGWQSGRIRV